MVKKKDKKHKKNKKTEKPVTTGIWISLLLILVSVCCQQAGKPENCYNLTPQNSLSDNTEISTMSQHNPNTGTYIMISGSSNYIRKNDKIVRWKSRPLWLSNKMRNKKIKIKNGNRETRNIIKITHWNMGNKKWENKMTEVDALILEKTPDIIFLSEANLFQTLPEHLRQIEGYKLHLPLTMSKHKYSRLVLLVKDGVNIKIHKNLMHEDLAVIWCSVLSGGKSVLKLGGVYREHQHLLKPKPNPSLTEQAQLNRWNLILHGWKRAASSKNCMFIGDTNLDFVRWHNPDKAHQKMILRTREEMEPLGFLQIINGVTRMWRG